MIFKALFGRKDKKPGDVDIGGTKDLLTVSRKLAASPERAFAVFVDEIDRWWPRDRTWAKDNLAAMVVEPRYKGRCFERSKDGAIAMWGTVLAFDRPQHIVFSWQIEPDGRPTENEGASSRVDVRFAAGEPGECNLLIVHRDFFRHGEGWEKYREEMAARSGWPMLVEAYVKALAG